MRRPGARTAVLLLALVAAALAGVVHETLFRNGSIDNDEVVYLLQGRLIASGHLLLHTPSPALAYQPWFFTPGPHGLVPKYWPTVGAWFGLSLAVTGSVVPALVLDAFALPLLMFGFCRGFLSERRSLLAAGLLALSPVVIIQSGLTLSYVPFAVLALAMWWLLRVLAQQPSWWRAVALGATATVAAATRPLDCALLMLPPGLLIAVRLARQGRLVRPLLGVVVGALPGAAALAVYDAYATGAVLRLPFNDLDSRDALGFGQRQLYPQDGLHYFGPLQSVDGFAGHFLLAPLTWFAGGVVLLPLAVVALIRWRTLAAEVRWLALAALVFAVGYLYFWGPWNASVLWGGPHTIGPFYALAVAVPVIVLACSVRIGLDRRALLAVGGVTAGVTASLTQLGVGVAHARRQAQATTTVLGVLAQGHAAAQQLSVETGSPYLGHPVSAVTNGDGQRPLLNNVVPAAPGVSAALLQLAGDPYAATGPDYDLVRQGSVTGADVAVTATFRPRRGGPDRGGTYALLMQRGPVRQLCAVDAHLAGTLDFSAMAAPRCAVASAVPLRLVGATDAGCQGGCVAVTLMQFGPGNGVHEAATRHIVSTVSGGRISVVTDGETVRARGGGWITVTGTPR